MNLSKKLSNSNADDCTTSLTESSPNDNISSNDNKESKNGKDCLVNKYCCLNTFLLVFHFKWNFFSKRSSTLFLGETV